MRIRSGWAGLAACVLGSLLAGVDPTRAAAPTYAPYELYPLGAMAESAVVADVNADGRDDVVVSTSNGITTGGYDLVVFHQEAGGAFAAPVRIPTLGELYDRNGMGLSAGDRCPATASTTSPWPPTPASRSSTAGPEA